MAWEHDLPRDLSGDSKKYVNLRIDRLVGGVKNEKNFKTRSP